MNLKDHLQQQSIIFTESECPGVEQALQQFFRATKLMEEEVMLPTRLRDLVLEKRQQPNGSRRSSSSTGSIPDEHSCYELFYFIRRIRDQLKCLKPFISEDDQITTQHDPNKLLITGDDYSNQQPSQNLLTGIDSNLDVLLSQLTYHYYGLIQIFKHLAQLANCVTSKYHEAVCTN